MTTGFLLKYAATYSEIRLAVEYTRSDTEVGPDFGFGGFGKPMPAISAGTSAVASSARFSLGLKQIN